MKWINSLSVVEYTFLAIFLVIYFIYFVRIRLLAKKLGTTARSAALKFFLRLLYFIMLIAALLGPSVGSTNSKSSVLGKDIFLVVDISKSMDATDVQPSRLDKVKFELLKMVDVLNENRIGLIAFSSEAFVQAPLTYDTDALKIFIQQLNTSMIEDGGSNLGEGLELISEKFSHEKAKKRNVKIAVLFTDGEDFESIADSTFKKIKQQSIFLKVVGVGTTKGSTIPLINGMEKRNKEGYVVISKLNTTLLQSLVRKTGGEFFRLNNEKNDLNLLATSIEKVENNEVDRRKFVVENNRYYYFLWIALLLIGIDIVITLRVIKI